jgi:hypothetical protein
MSDTSFDELNIVSPLYLKTRISSVRKNMEEETKNSECTGKATKFADDPLDNYLKRLGGEKISKDSPVRQDENKIEVPATRKSGRSGSPLRKSKTSIPSKYKESTNIPLTSSQSSEDQGIQEIDDDIILEELNELYHVFLSWIFSSKAEYDCSKPIRYHMMLPVCLNLSAKSTKLMKQKAISDFNFMTAVEKNASIIMKERTFSRWILDLLYTVFPPKFDTDKDPIWDMGCKLYIHLNKVCFNTDLDSHFYLHNLTTWPINRIIQLKHRKDVYKNEIRKKERMVRTILFSFFDTLSADKERDKYPPSFTSDTNYKTFWYNLVN